MTMLLEVTGLCVLVGLVLYVYLTWTWSHWKKLGVPYDEPILFFGSLREAFTGRKHSGIVYQEIYKRFDKAAYVGAFALRTPVILVRDLDLIKDVLVKDFWSFQDNPPNAGTTNDPILRVNPFLSAGEEWKKRRVQWSVNSTLNKVKMLFEEMQREQKIMLEYINRHVEENLGEPMEAKQIGFKFLTDVMVRGAMGLKSNAFKDENNIFKRITESVTKPTFIDNIGVLAYTHAPWLHKYISFGWVKPWIRKELNIISENIVAIRKEHGFFKCDFFQNLIEGQDSVDIREVAGRAFGFLSSGIESPSSLIAFILFELACNTQIQKRLRKELDELAAANNGELSYEDISNCKYLDMIANETMRIYPAILIMSKVCTKPYTFPPAEEGGNPLEIPVGTNVVICNYATNMDPKYFPDPETFDPERFADTTSIPKMAFIPFGEGPRICVGMKLGITSSKSAVASIIRNFEVRVSPRTQKRPLTIDPNALLVRAVGGIWVTFYKIKKD